jgi:hypothetical protein
MGHLRPGKTVQDIAMSKGIVPSGVAEPVKQPVTPTTLPAANAGQPSATPNPATGAPAASTPPANTGQ